MVTRLAAAAMAQREFFFLVRRPPPARRARAQDQRVAMMPVGMPRRAVVRGLWPREETMRAAKMKICSQRRKSFLEGFWWMGGVLGGGGTYASVGDALGNGKGEEEPGFGVADALADLVPLYPFVLDACVVVADAVQADELFTRGQVAALGGRVGEEEDEEGGPEEGEGSEDEEEQAPACQRGVRASDSVTDGAGEDGAELGHPTEKCRFSIRGSSGG